MAEFASEGNDDIEVNIDIDIAQIREALARDQDFLRVVSDLVRIQLTKDARSMGNLFGKWAQGR